MPSQKSPSEAELARLAQEAEEAARSLLCEEEEAAEKRRQAEAKADRKRARKAARFAVAFETLLFNCLKPLTASPCVQTPF